MADTLPRYDAGMNTDVHDTVAQQLRRTRQRYTDGRRQLVDVLLGAGRPVTIPELTELGAAQSQSSLYRNLAVMERSGAVHRVVSGADVTRYELTEEHTEHHHHLVCNSCGNVEDLTLPAGIERALARPADEANGKRDFTVQDHRFELMGTCATCT